MQATQDLVQPPSSAARDPLGQIGAGLRELGRGFLSSFGDRFSLSCILAFLLGAGGFVSFFLGWRGAADTLVVAVQLAYLMSGGFTGLALIATGIGLLYIQLSRRVAAREHRELEVLLDRALDLLAEVKKDEPGS